MFFEVQLEVGGHVGSAGFGTTGSRRTSTSSEAVLGQIEKLGWRLEHAGYYFMITGETSTDRVFVSGEATSVSGRDDRGLPVPQHRAAPRSA